MDAAVALVQAHPRPNGYFTETEYPVVGMEHGHPATLTDIDVPAARFPGAGRWVPGARETLSPAPLLDVASDRMDMIIGEVKEAPSRMNPAAYTVPVLETALRRFGCCVPDPHETARAILRGERCYNHSHAQVNCRIRLIVFGGGREPGTSRYQVINYRRR